MKHLWEINHPYYATEGNYFSNDMHTEYKSWADFVDEFGDSDLDMNLIYRWDWKALEYEEDYETQKWKGDPNYRDGELKLFFIGQRKAKCWSTSVQVCHNDEDEIIKFLKPRLEKLKTMWEPLS